MNLAFLDATTGTRSKASLPLEGKDSPMPASLIKTHRQGALIALGAAVRWSP
ncbi:hypothetical protein N9821_02115 [Akkermansiaceae bacterium]|nr:hypothetical protein [Akkermansiaceae bacterium]MDB4290492.1 hypothetical protein [bacterium]MDA7862764.1 hypothetical protein [Akkermansiaceae bacterium]MDB4259927.1 hypothetical protein [Akkermansiaceae bacterium]MDB4275567.1 hypothetical protein [Akkermansiaceae bacterium]